MRLDPDNPKGIYIVMVSIHGLVRSREMELGRDMDTGGQVKYVIELAKTLARRKEVERVDLLTRQVIDPKVSDSYTELYEEIAPKAFLVRIPAGPRRYLRKEVLWPHLLKFEENAMKHIRRAGRPPDLIHGHYADAGLVGARLAYLLGVPFAFTGHSLGRVKQERLLASGLSQERIEKAYNITQRIMAEETALEAASLVVTSTSQEIGEQYSNYDKFKKLTARVIPPGVNIEAYGPAPRSQKWPPIFYQIGRFLENPYKPMILAMARPDERKNLTGLIKAYAENPELRKTANMLIVAGNRDNIEDMNPGPRAVMEKILLLIDKYDLYGLIAYPKHHDQDEVVEIYRIAARTGGVFVNPALTEPFGLTLIEAAACGLPIVATNDGGPIDIIENCHNGQLIDPLDGQTLGQTLLEVVSDRKKWKEYAQNGLKGVKKHYSWQSHVSVYLNTVKKIVARKAPQAPAARYRNRLAFMHRLLITDIDNTLLGDEQAIKDLFEQIDHAPIRFGFGVATGRHRESAVKVLEKWRIPKPDVLITSVGSEIFSGPHLIADESWARHINHKWDPEGIRQAVAEMPGLTPQASENQRRFKVSYNVIDREFPGVKQIRNLIKQKNLVATVIYSHGRYLDFLPARASKGKALRFLAIKWGILMDNILVAGDSGNDREMLSTGSQSIVVGNYSPELASLKKKENIFFAKKHYAAGIIEGIEHFRFLDPPEEY